MAFGRTWTTEGICNVRCGRKRDLSGKKRERSPKKSPRIAGGQGYGEGEGKISKGSKKLKKPGDEKEKIKA